MQNGVCGRTRETRSGGIEGVEVGEGAYLSGCVADRMPLAAPMQAQHLRAGSSSGID